MKRKNDDEPRVSWLEALGNHWTNWWGGYVTFVIVAAIALLIYSLIYDQAVRFDSQPQYSDNANTIMNACLEAHQGYPGEMIACLQDAGFILVYREKPIRLLED